MPNSRFDSSAVRRVYQRLLPPQARQKLQLSRLKKLIAPSRKLYHRAIPAETRQKLRLGQYMPTVVRRQLAMMPTVAELPPPPPPPFRPVIGIVIPAFNRRENLERCLGILSWQTLQDFVVMIADDGSTDGTRELVLELRQNLFWQERLLFVSGGPKRGVRTGRARNIGTANLPPTVRVMMQLDTDMLLAPNALAEIMRWHEWYPRTLLIGQIDWLPALETAEFNQVLTTEGLDGLRARVPQQPAERIGGTYVGQDLRLAHGLEFHTNTTPPPMPVLVQPAWYLPGTAACAIEDYWAIGGYDEQMRGYGYQDTDFGTRLAAAGVEMLAVSDIWCVHVWHPSVSEDHLVTAQRNLDYLIRKYERASYPAETLQFFEDRVEWQYWWHYNWERGGKVFKQGGELWAVNRAGTHRLKLPHAGWAQALGFAEADIVEDASANFAEMTDVGVAHDPLGDGLDYWLPPRKS